ncbi:sensor histidine kinase [Ferruginibacter sp.]|nr:sensor histidine kinase [Ferruginibacter sp.]
MPQDIRYYFITSVIAFLLLGLFMLLLAALYSRKQQKNKNEKMKMQTQFQQELLQTQIEIQEQTLKTISEEIHDNVGQILSLAKLNLNTLDNTADQKIQDTKNLVSKAINDLRNLSRSIHGDRIAQLGLQQSIEDELNILQNSGQFTTALKIVGNHYKLDPQKEMVLFRIVQEALNNAVKYSKAKNITVQLNYQPQIFSLTISDDGIGFNVAALPASKTGIGLTSMQNRAALIGGAFTITSAAGNGTIINIELKTL